MTAHLDPHALDAPARPMPWPARAAAAILPVAITAVLGSLATTPQIPGWYASIAKPAFNPPNWIFGPVWTVLFIMIAWAAWRILARDPATPGRTAALGVLWFNLTLNASWSFAFFGANSPALGLVVIVPLLASILALIVLFRPLDRLSAAMMVPYAAWVSFAMLLNAAIWRLN
jgi:tryptophan-rich sensory protein